MVCAKCGCEQVGGGQFCRQCGAPVAAAMPQQQAWAAGTGPQAPPYLGQWRPMRVVQHVQPLGITWCLYGAFRLVKGIVAATVLGTLARSGMLPLGDAPAFVPHLLQALAPVIMVTSVVMAALSILTGYALLARKSWGRTLAIVAAILSLIKIPLGTALGIYTLWVLAPAVSGMEWEAVQRREAAV